MDDNFVVVSPDIGSVARARKVAARMNAKMAIIDKRRPKANVMEVMNIIGEVDGKNCLMIDDMIDTAGTIVQGAKALKEAGAKEIYACCSNDYEIVVHLGFEMIVKRRSADEIIQRNIEKALNLQAMQIHSKHPVRTRGGN